MLYSCTHTATVGVKGLADSMFFLPRDVAHSAIVKIHSLRAISINLVSSKLNCVLKFAVNGVCKRRLVFSSDM